jgi:hypothetical protein
MCFIKDEFVGEENFDVIKMHGTTIKKIYINVINVTALLTLLVQIKIFLGA